MNEALNQFLAKSERHAFSMAQFATGSRSDALDIVQDAMIKLTVNYTQHSPQEWPPLFHRILQRQITDWHRRSKLQQTLFFWSPKNSEDKIDSVDDYIDHSNETSEQMLSNQQSITVLQASLLTLPMRQRQAFLLRCWQGLSTAETAEAMGCSSGSVKTHYHRALTTLRHNLEEIWL